MRVLFILEGAVRSEQIPNWGEDPFQVVRTANGRTGSRKHRYVYRRGQRRAENGVNASAENNHPMSASSPRMKAPKISQTAVARMVCSLPRLPAPWITDPYQSWQTLALKSTKKLGHHPRRPRNSAGAMADKKGIYTSHPPSNRRCLSSVECMDSLAPPESRS
jgi:hypothetical protein